MVDAGKPAKVGDGKVDLGAVKLRIDRLEEFPQIFAEAWRIQRDWFYDQNMHGVDWQAMYDKYAPFVAGCGTRGDLNYLIGEMIAELNIGHTYIFGGDYEDGGAARGHRPAGRRVRRRRGQPTTTGSPTSCPGVPWDPRYRSPLAEPGVDIERGRLPDRHRRRRGPQAATTSTRHLVDKAGKMVTLTTNDKPAGQGRRDRPRADPAQRVQAALPGLGRRQPGLRDREDRRPHRLHPHAQHDASPAWSNSAAATIRRPGSEAMIIDDRYNGGGFVGDMIIDRLERELWAMTSPARGQDRPQPRAGASTARWSC